MRIGDVELLPVSDGQAWTDGGGMYGLVPRVLWERVTPPDALNRVAMTLTCLLIRSAGKMILVDTGYGSKLPEKRRQILSLQRHPGLPGALEPLGLTAAAIDIVINTHLHSDHCGGNTTLVDGTPLPTYPRAEYWVQRLEWADALFPNERTQVTYLPENLRPVEPQLRLLDGDTRVTPEVRCIVTRGHTRAHQSVLIESGGQTAIYLGDLAPYPVHMERLAWIAANDVEPLEALETKRSLRRFALERDALLLFEHDAHIIAGRLVEADGALRVAPVQTY
ncbi:MAG TPA: MBL fold metallo-hydrolase [Anaerolineae bacterium]|nr:MBL fold metallo-hydrolase [Anaerolineae bacterium]HOR00699.1 MBL fold metallo-hydrolase [Anaerolineae bacterium]HPL28432.1 MBL fold metallo-hydrolase [Anaerolineae bacterium]